MKVRYFEDTDTLYIELREAAVVETRDLDENTLIDMDDQGRMVAMTIEHAQDRAELANFLFERVEACVWRRGQRQRRRTRRDGPDF